MKLLSPPNRVLVIGLRRLGDLLLATPLISSLKAAWPQATIDVLTSAGGEAMLAGNPDVHEVLLYRRGGSNAALLRRILGRYDLSVSLQPEDRAQFLALVSSRRRASVVPGDTQEGARWKRWINHAWVPVGLHWNHAVIQYLQLADALGIGRRYAVVPPRPEDIAGTRARLHELGVSGRFAVIHPTPMFRYKAWHAAGWRELIHWLISRELKVIVSGGPGTEEKNAIAELLAGLGDSATSIVDVAGELSLAELAVVLADAQIYIGPDTSITHLAAASGTPTIALFGPSNPVAWGPWPRNCEIATGGPWIHASPLQHTGNVWIVQGIAHCVPCMQEGCERKRDSRADCLDTLPFSRVLSAARAALEQAPGRG